MGMTDLGRSGWGNGWVQAPAYDESIREAVVPAVPGAPLTTSASADDPALIDLVHPDVPRTLEMLDQAGSMPPMRLRPPSRSRA
jgi:hypothetical protein